MKTRFVFTFFFAALTQIPGSFASLNEPEDCPKIDKASPLYLDVMNGVNLEGKTYTLGETTYYALTRNVSPRAMHPSRKINIEQYLTDLENSHDIKWRAKSGNICFYRYIKNNKEMELALNTDRLQ